MPEEDHSQHFSEQTQKNASKALRIGIAAYCWVLVILGLLLAVGFMAALIYMALSRH